MSQFNSPNSCHIFNDSKICDDDGDLNILRSSRTYSKDKEICDSGNEGSLRESTANTKYIASSSLSCENNLFIDENTHSERKKTHENKKMNEDSLISIFDNKEAKCSASGCDFSNELPSPIFPHKTYQRTRKNLKKKVIEKELKLDELKSKHPSSNMLLKSVLTSNQQSCASLSMSSKVKLNNTKGNIQHSPSLSEVNGKCTIVKKETKTSVSSYNRQFTQNSKKEFSMLDFVRRYSVEQNQAHINSRKSNVRKKPKGSKISDAKKLTHGLKSSIHKIAPKSTGMKKGYNKSNKCQKSNDTVIEKSTTTHKLNHDNFKHIERPDNDKHSMQKPLQKSFDESNFGSPVLHASPLPSFVTHSTEVNDSYEDSTKCVQVDQSNTSSSCLEVVFKDLSDNLESNCAFNNAAKPLQKSYDESNFESPVLHSSPLPSFVTHSTEINDSLKDSTECVQVVQSNTSSSCLEVLLKDLSDSIESNCAFNNAAGDLGTLTHELLLHTTVKDFCSHHNTLSILSKLSCGNNSHPLFYNKKYPEMNLDNGGFENFLNCSILGLIEGYAKDIIFDMFPKLGKLETEKISTNKIIQYFYERCNDNEALYVSRFFCGGQLLNLGTVISKLNCVALLLMYDDFKKGSKN